MQANIKIKNNKKLQIEVLVDSRYTHTEINKKLVKDRRIQTRLINFSFGIYNTNRTKNRDVTKVALLEVKINKHKEHIEVAVIDLNGMDMFLGHDWLVKYNPDIIWKEGKIQFTRCLELCRMKHQDIKFKTRRIQATETNNKD